MNNPLRSQSGLDKFIVEDTSKNKKQASLQKPVSYLNHPAYISEDFFILISHPNSTTLSFGNDCANLTHARHEITWIVRVPRAVPVQSGRVASSRYPHARRCGSAIQTAPVE